MFSLEEQIILNNIDKDFEWIVRDSDNWLYVYKGKPFKQGKGWNSAMGMSQIGIFNHLFKDIKWEDAEPTKIERGTTKNIDPKEKSAERVFNQIDFIKKWNNSMHDEFERLSRKGLVKHKPSNHAKQVIDNQIKKGLERYGMGIENCDLSIKELLDNALEENADAMIYLAELRARLVGNENK